ncbi:hypothetical protein CKAH01_13263 [Colletotrichum kahawae]|uniref:Uncharacterized protein n=1 Tax=Colletotrichum kahawae TaxID=34407 RepID=A0AAE0DBB0_COLKA|nr:hypothetical protein CKAH01_13263 [Colletotrichum kahawae]
MKFHASVGLLLLQSASIVTGLCTCLATTQNGVENDIEAGKRCCKGTGDKLSGNLCNAANFDTFASCCESQKGSEAVTPSAFDCSL